MYEGEEDSIYGSGTEQKKKRGRVKENKEKGGSLYMGLKQNIVTKPGCNEKSRKGNETL